MNKLDAAAKVVLKALASPFMPAVSPPEEEETRARRPCDEMIAKLQENKKTAPIRAQAIGKTIPILRVAAFSALSWP